MSSHEFTPAEPCGSETDWPASICVYCGSSTGQQSQYANAARAFGALLARRRIRLVFGGGSVGLMGVIADAVLDAGGQATGVIPHSMREAELAHEGLSELIVVDSMHERKQRMVELADAFIALPGGIGTMDELFETWTWLQLGIHAKPVGLLNVGGYYDPLVTFLQQMAGHGFLRKEHLESLLIDNDPERLLVRFSSFDLPRTRRRRAPKGQLEP